MKRRVSRPGGCVLIADFGPHEMEDLRMSMLIVLGFADDEMNHMLRRRFVRRRRRHADRAKHPFDRCHVAGRKNRKKCLMTSISFEFFPPKSEAASENLWQAIGRLAPLRPNFVSVTYGAGGSTRDRTHQCVKRIIDETDLKPAAHLTCVAASKADVDSVVNDYAAAGVKHIVALRGDMPDMGRFSPS